MNDKEQIKNVVNSVALLQDMKQWERLEEYFVKKPFIDNKALNGETPAVIPKQRLINEWRREIGSYFYATRHFIRRLAVRMVNSRRAKVTTLVENVHYVADRGERYAWTVRGTVEYILIKSANGSWRISQMIFRLQDQVVKPVGVAV
ncbi:MAG TPA: nuclear transport factor 2 family protein [Candidatus Saccharimonadales bacterium]|nr:nuclear transport factor 2 family protein [Candidatus Saccharimonadales bacterium]